MIDWYVDGQIEFFPFRNNLSNKRWNSFQDNDLKPNSFVCTKKEQLKAMTKNLR